MAKTINISFKGEAAVFAYKPIDRTVLYGKRRRIAFDEAGNECAKASLLADGSLLIRSGMTAQGYFTPENVWVPQGELEAVNLDGSIPELFPATVGESVEASEVSANSASVHNAVVVRLRNDKACTFEDIGWNQITRLIPIAEVSDQIKLGTSEVIRRQVWSKEGSGKVDVRKLLIWKTNKESAGYPAYVVHWTDYSSTRKSPLDREVRLAPNEKEAVKIAEAMIVENIKKGWSEVVK
jgi:hypothetical protein